MWAAWVWSLLVTILGPLVKHVVFALGFSMVIYTGIDFVFDALQNYIYAEFMGLPANLVAILGLLRVDEAINITFSAISFRLIFLGVSGGMKKNWVWNKPGTNTLPA